MHYTLCDFIIDLTQNSIESGADLIMLAVTETDHIVNVEIKDNGCGMTEEELEKAKDPFYSNDKKHQQRKIGLGIPFLLQTITMTNGKYDIHTEKGKGTDFLFQFPLDHPDTPPLGELPLAFFHVFTFSEWATTKSSAEKSVDASTAIEEQLHYEMIISREKNSSQYNGAYEIKRSDLLQVLENFDTIDNLKLLKDYIYSQEKDITESDN